MNKNANRSGVAIVGMALRVPGASTLDEFWHQILSGNDCLRRATRQELRRSGVSKIELSDPRFVTALPHLGEAAYFDPEFFGMSAYEAERTEPAQRLFLECAYEALEHASIVPGRNRQKISVIAGSEGEYRHENLDHLDDDESLQVTIGNDVDFTTNRVANRLDLTGPTVTVLSACATSLAAVHLGMAALRRGDCDIVIAGGSTVLDNTKLGYMSMDDGMISSSGVVRPFDDRADGTIFGSGVSAVVLRPLEDALVEGQEIYGVLLGAGSSNDGNPPGKKTFTAPSPEGQIMAIESAVADAGVDPATISLAECHGTATRLGDPVEIASLTRVYRQYTDQISYCALGSAKSNFGHLRTAAGGIGLIKACLAMRHAILPRVANLDIQNQAVDFAASPFYTPMTSDHWPQREVPRRACVSAFGFGGTNTHVIVEEAPTPETPLAAATQEPKLCMVSARSQAALYRRISDLQRYLDDHPETNLDALAHTLRNGRLSMTHRAVLLADPAASFRNPLLLPPAITAPRKVAFLLPGQGSQYMGMGLEVYLNHQVYRQTVDHCAEILEPLIHADIRELIHTSEIGEQEQQKALRQTANTQPALFVVEYAMAKQLEAWGVSADVLLGHSVGELVAACLAGVFSLEDGLKIVSARSRLMQSCDPGVMLAVLTPADDFSDLLNDEVELGALNAPTINVVSGKQEAITIFELDAARRNIATRRLRTSHAFHSHMMEPVLESFHSLLSGIVLSAPKIPIISNVSGNYLSDAHACDPNYWAEQIRRPVNFTSGVRTLLDEDDFAFMEVGPGNTLSELVDLHGSDAPTIGTFGTEERPTSGQGELGIKVCVGRIWQAGAELSPERYKDGNTPRLLTLPTYPFQRRKYWLNEDEHATQQDNALFLYKPSWVDAPIDSDLEADPEDTWLVLHDRQALASAILSSLELEGRSFVSVTPRSEFSAESKTSYCLRPGSIEDYTELFEAISASSVRGRLRVLNLWLLTGAEEIEQPIDNFVRHSVSGHNFSLAFVQAAHIAGIQEKLDIVIVGNEILARAGEESALVPEKAGVLGPAMFIPLEMQYIRMRVLDVTGVDDRQVPDWAVSGILAESLANDNAGSFLLRPEGRFIEKLSRLRDLPISRNCLRSGGSVLITGGVGGIGMELARDLFESARANLVLTTRWDVPSPDTWRDRATQNDKVGRALAGILALQDRGAQILLVKADSTSLDDLENAVAAARKRFGAIHGVIHAAGAATLQLALEEKPEVHPDMLAKVFGALHLDRIFADTPLDFILYLSSQSTHVPIRYGQSVYSGANRVLNALAERRRSRNLGLTAALGWGPWEKIGMAAIFSEDLTRTSTDGVVSDGELIDTEGLTDVELQSKEVLVSVLCRAIGSGGNNLTEISGYVKATGKRVRDLTPGEAVVAMVVDRDVGDEIVLPAARVVSVPDNVILEFAAAMPRAFLSAAYAIEKLGGIEKDDCVLITCGDSAPGQAAVQIALKANAKVIVMTSEPGHHALRGAAACLPAEIDDISAAVRVANNGKGADLALVLQSEDMLEQAANALEASGRLIDITFGKLRENIELPRSFAANSLGYVPLNVESYIENRSEESIELLDDLMTDFAKGKLFCPRVPVIEHDHDANTNSSGKGLGVLQLGQHKDPWRAKARAFFEHYGVGVTPESGLETFRNLLACDSTPSTIIVLGSELDDAADATDSYVTSAGSHKRRPDLDTLYREATSKREFFLVELWERTLEIDGIGVDDDFFDLGGNSVMVIRILFAIFSEYGERLPSSIMAHASTISLLAEEIFIRMKAA